MIVEGEEIPEIVVENLMHELVTHPRPFCTDDVHLLSTAMHPLRRGYAQMLFVNRILDRLRRDKKIECFGGCWLVVDGA